MVVTRESIVAKTKALQQELALYDSDDQKHTQDWSPSLVYALRGQVAAGLKIISLSAEEQQIEIDTINGFTKKSSSGLIG
jgi:hypothetical protein